MTDPILLGTLYGTNHALRQTANNYADKIEELREYRCQERALIAQLQDQLAEKDRFLASWRNHYVGLEAERDYLLKLLDEAYGADKNPARKYAYPESEQLRIPAGPRKGERVTMRDHIYFDTFAKVFKRDFSGLAKCWKDFISDKIYE